MQLFNKNYTLIDGNKDAFVYFLLKYNDKQVFPLYELDNEQIFAWCRKCGKYQKTMLNDGSEGSDYFHCLYCDTYNEDNYYSPYYFNKSKEKANYFNNKYIVLEKNVKVRKKNKLRIEQEINNFCNKGYSISNKKHNKQIQWAHKISTVNKEITNKHN